MGFTIFVIPGYQILCWFTSLIIFCRNKQKIHFFHSVHGVVRFLTTLFQVLAIVYLIFLQQFLLRQYDDFEKLYYNDEIVYIVLGYTVFIFVSNIIMIKSGLHAKWNHN